MYSKLDKDGVMYSKLTWEQCRTPADNWLADVLLRADYHGKYQQDDSWVSVVDAIEQVIIPPSSELTNARYAIKESRDPERINNWLTILKYDSINSPMLIVRVQR